jgi:hypothetical protein
MIVSFFLKIAFNPFNATVPKTLSSSYANVTQMESLLMVENQLAQALPQNKLLECIQLANI